jgi:hypothetical protein
LIAQNPQARVHFSPAIMKVAVPWFQHSQRFGHCASSQTVTSFKSPIRFLVVPNSGRWAKRTFSHSGLRCRFGATPGFESVAQHLLIAPRS